MSKRTSATLAEPDTNPMTVWVTLQALGRGVRVVLTRPHENPRLARGGWRTLITTRPDDPYHVGPKDWHRTEAEALARVKTMLATHRRRVLREHAREMARLDGIAEALKAGRLPIAGERVEAAKGEEG